MIINNSLIVLFSFYVAVVGLFLPKLWLGSNCNRLKHLVLLYHRILDNCLSRTSRFTHAGVIYIPAIIVQAYKFATTRGPKSQICFLSIFFVVVVVRNYMVQVPNLEQGPSPPVKWVCHGWRRRMCSCVNEPPSPFRGWDLHPSLFRDAAHAVSCPLLFFPFISTVNLFTFSYSCTSLTQHLFCLCPSISFFTKILSSLASDFGHNSNIFFFFFLRCTTRIDRLKGPPEGFCLAL